MRVDVIDTALRVVFGDEESRVLPDGGASTESHDAPEGEIVVGDIRRAEGIAIGGPRLHGVIVGQANHDQSRDLARGELAREVSFELLDTELVGDAEIEGWEAAIGGFEDRLRRGRSEETLALGLGARELSVAFDLEAFAIVEDAFATGGDVFQSEPNCGSSSGMGASAPPKSARRPG